MIIAYFILGLSLFVVFCIMLAIFGFMFTDKINHKEKEVKQLAGIPLIFWLLICVCSAQYIWG